jgi:hypothetical protein
MGMTPGSGRASGGRLSRCGEADAKARRHEGHCMAVRKRPHMVMSPLLDLYHPVLCHEARFRYVIVRVADCPCA